VACCWPPHNSEKVPHLPIRQAIAKRPPAPRANPFPKVTDPFCRLPLPTLFYQLEAAHLGDLLRLSVRHPPGFLHSWFPDFHGPSPVFPAPTSRQCLALPPPLRRLIRFQGHSVGQMEKTFPPGSRASVSWFPCVAVSARRLFRNIDRIPFQSFEPFTLFLFHTFRPLFRIDSPVSKHCSHGTFLLFSLQCSLLNICYYHQDLHQRLFQPASLPTLSTTPAPSYSLLLLLLLQRHSIGRSLQRHPFSGLIHSAGEL
jgi:hypothetical protein